MKYLVLLAGCGLGEGSGSIGEDFYLSGEFDIE